MLYNGFKKFGDCFFGLEFNGKLSYTQFYTQEGGVTWN